MTSKTPLRHPVNGRFQPKPKSGKAKPKSMPPWLKTKVGK